MYQRPYPGYRPLPPPPPPPPPRPSWKDRTRLVLVASLAVLVATGAVLIVLVAGGSPGGSKTEAAHPERWDPRVKKLVTFVERERGLDFKYPVYVDFLTPSEYREVITDDSGRTEEDRADLLTFAGEIRALGLLSGDFDVESIMDDLASEGTLAFYSDETERITVRGTRLTPGLRVTLVHELTHALQDQHFDIGRELDTDGAATAFRALVEGDAVRVENAYAEKLSRADREDYEEETEQQTDEATEGLAGVPEVFQVFFGSPYALGEPFVQVLLNSGDQEALDAAFRNPPGGELAILDPGSWLDEEGPEKVEEPKLGKGEKELHAGDLGALELYVMLASRIDAQKAMAAIDGWDGDAYVSYETSGRTCLRAAVVAAGSDETRLLHGAFVAWAATFRTEPPVVDLAGSVIKLSACDPGPAAERGPDGEKVTESLALPVTRSLLMAEFLDIGYDEDESRCVGQRVITSFTPRELADPEGRVAQTEAFFETMSTIVKECAGV